MTVRYTWGPCPVCGHEAQCEVADREQLRSETERLWSFHMRRLQAETPPEMLADRVAFSQYPPLRIARCERCTHLFRNPHERDEVLEDTYAGEAPDEAALRSLHDAQLPAARAQMQRLRRHAGRAGGGFEIGSYAGAFLTAAREQGWHVTGVDVNEACVKFVRDAGHSAIQGSILDVPRDTAADAICLWNCLDQLPDPAAAVRAARERLRPGGTLVARVPNGAFYAAVRRARPRALADAVLALNNLLAFPYRHGFTPHSLATLLADAGLRLRHIHGDALVPTSDRWTRRWARVEERLLKGVIRHAPAPAAPWIEAWAVAPPRNTDGGRVVDN